MYWFCQISKWIRHRYTCGEVTLIPGLGRCPGEENGNPFQYSCLGNPMDIEVWRAAFHGVTKVGHDWVTKHSHTHSFLFVFFFTYMLWALIFKWAIFPLEAICQILSYAFQSHLVLFFNYRLFFRRKNKP